jgi:enoyl-CoA hydratase/carnithine racemase
VGEFVSTELEGSVAVVTIDHPPVNALSAPLLEELEAEIDRLDGDDDVRAIVLVGAGERAFVAGADISEFPAQREAEPDAQESGSARGIQKLGHRMDAARTPFVAAIQGFCLGGGPSSRCAATSASPRRTRSSASRRSSWASFRAAAGRSVSHGSSASAGRCSST